MVQVGRALGGGCALLVAILAVLSALTGLSAVGWAAGLGCGLGVAIGVGRGTARDDVLLTPADLVTLCRVVLACAAAGLVVDTLGAATTAVPVTVLAAVALALDAVDGRVARATGRGSAFGARFDGEADAFLLLVLSVHLAPAYGGWVLLIGVARYAFWAAGWGLVWFRRPLPPRPWSRVVAAIQGVALVVASAAVLPRPLTVGVLVAALVLLAESFGRDTWWLVRQRHASATGLPARVGAGRSPA